MSESETDRGPSAWADEVTALLAELGSLPQLARLMALIGGPFAGEPPEVAAALLRVHAELGGSAVPGSYSTSVASLTATVDGRLSAALETLARRTDDRLAQLAASGVTDRNRTILSWTSFGDGDRLDLNGLAVVRMSAVPADHPVRGLLARTDCEEGLQIAGPQGGVIRVLVLGPRGQRWYGTAEAARLTSGRERERRQALEAQLAREKAREDAERRAWEQSPAGQMELLRQRVATLEQQQQTK